MSESDKRYLVVGEILKPWGFRGQVKVKIITDYPNRLVKHKTVYLGDHLRPLEVESAKLHSGYVLMKFTGLESDTAVAKLRGEIVHIPADEAAPLKKNQYYHHQLIGLAVVTASGEPVGTLDEILETGANDVYLVHTSEGKEILLPAIKSVIKKIDLPAKTITVDLIPGLID